MSNRKMLVIGLVLLCSTWAWALEPNEILVIANANCAASVRLARYYCQARGLPTGYVIPVSLGSSLRDSISRSDYERRLAKPLRRIFATRPDLADIKCLVTTYGVPFKVGPRGPLTGSEGQLSQLRGRLEEENEAMAQLEQKEQTGSADYTAAKRKKMRVQMDIDRIGGSETQASVDSELSMVLCGHYELYRWQPNLLRTVPVMRSPGGSSTRPWRPKPTD